MNPICVDTHRIVVSEEGQDIVECGLEVFQETDYVLNGVIVQRPILAFDKTSIAADDTDTATLAGLPDPCTVSIDGTEYEVTGGTLEVTSPLPATYHVEITDENAFPAQALNVEITAT